MLTFENSSDPCGMANQVPQPYSSLPAWNYSWTDQYTSGDTHEKTSRTNYHTIMERSDGKTALIFEECVGQTACVTNQAGNRECECGGVDGESSQNQWLSTTGFTSGDVPTLIVNWSSGPLNPNGIRVTHPAISGPSQNNRWLLFFMRGKKIWYTKIKEIP